jgi:hypothetical protein
MTISATTQGIKPGVCLSTNRPANPFDGQVIYMTDVDQTAVWDGTQWTVLAPIAGGRNVIINGAMGVWQRGTSFTSSYTTDRWLGASNAGSQTWSRSTDVPTGFTYSLSQASTTGTNPQIQQTIEATNIKRLVGQTVTVSFYAKSTAGSSQLSLFTAYPTATDNFASQTTDSAGSTNFTLTSSWARYSFSYTLSASATTGYKVVLYRNESSASSTTLITGVQLEAGAVATPFEFEDAQVTLAKCERYYYQQVSGTSKVFAQGFFYNSAQWEAAVFFPVTMRTAPSLVVSSGSNYYNTRETSARQVSGITIARGHENGALLYGTVSGGVAGAGAGIETVNAAGSVAYNAEL